MTSLIRRLANRISTSAEDVGQRVEPLTGAMHPVAPAPSSTFIKDLLDAQDQSPDRRRVGMSGSIHVSSLIGFCPRAHAIHRLYQAGQYVMQSVTGGHRLVWAIGRSVEHHIREQIIADRRSTVYGVWTCRCGASRHEGFPTDRQCGRCQHGLTHYGELTLEDTEAGVIGNPDILLLVNNALMAVEIKSITKDDWEALTAPKGDHIFQAGWYVRLLRQLGHRVHAQTHVIYARKEFKWGSPYKELVFDATAGYIEDMLTESRELAITAHAAVASGVLPARICPTHDCARAKKCTVTVPCFSRG